MSIDIDKDDNNIAIHQGRYVKKITKKLQHGRLQPSLHPLGNRITTLIGRNYCTIQRSSGSTHVSGKCSRPDIAFATGKVARASANPKQTDWTEVKQIFRYLKGTPNIQITYTKSDRVLLEAYCDADYAGDPNSCKSTTGNVLTINGSPVAWTSRLQRTVSVWTTEAEYNALAETTKEVMWTRDLLEERDCKQNHPTKIHCDNQSTIKLVNNDEACRRTKHMAVKVHFVKDEIANQTIQTEYVEPTKQKADFLTKPLTKDSFEKNRKSLRMTQQKMALLMCLMLFNGHIIKTQAMFHQYLPIVWRKSSEKVVSGAELMKYKLKLLSPCEMFRQLNHTHPQHIQ